MSAPSPAKSAADPQPWSSTTMLVRVGLSVRRISDANARFSPVCRRISDVTVVENLASHSQDEESSLVKVNCFVHL